MALDEIRQPEKKLLALIRLELAPGPLKCLAGSRDGAIDVLGVALGHGRQHFAGCWVATLEALSRCCIDPSPTNQPSA